MAKVLDPRQKHSGMTKCYVEFRLILARLAVQVKTETLDWPKRSVYYFHIYMTNIRVRPYEAKDRAQLRTLCCDVADRGESIEPLFFDRELAADMLTAYYTDYEPRSSFVAEHNGSIVGYVNGCVDNRRYGLVMFWILIPAALIRGFKRGIFFRRELWHMVHVLFKNWRRIFAWRKESFHSHQGHLHIGIDASFRNQHLGEQLIKALVERAVGKRVGELTASVHDANKPAMRFFERLGFVVRERHYTIMARGKGWEEYNALFYVKTITP